MQSTTSEKPNRLPTTYRSFKLRTQCVQVSQEQQSLEVEEMTSWLTRQAVPKKPLWQNLICSKEHKVSICPVYKAASTFLLKKFLLIAPSKSYSKWVVGHFNRWEISFDTLQAGSQCNTWRRRPTCSLERSSATLSPGPNIQTSPQMVSFGQISKLIQKLWRSSLSQTTKVDKRL